MTNALRPSEVHDEDVLTPKQKPTAGSILGAELGEQAKLTCADLAEATGRSPELFRRLAREGLLKAYRLSHGEKTPYRFKASEFKAFWEEFQKEAEPWRIIASSERRKTESRTAPGGRAKGGKGIQPSTSTAVQTISEVLRSARMSGMKG